MYRSNKKSSSPAFWPTDYCNCQLNSGIQNVHNSYHTKTVKKAPVHFVTAQLYYTTAQKSGTYIVCFHEFFQFFWW